MSDEKIGSDQMTGSDDGGAGAFLSPDASRDYLRTWREDAERRAERAQAMASRVEALRTTARDDNDLATVTVDSSGALVDLELTDRIRHYEPSVVARAVMSALRKARATTAERAQEIAAEALGPDSMSVRMFAEQLRKLSETPEPGGERA